jgi:hypothetical protein
MTSAGHAFGQLVDAIVARAVRQNAQPVPPAADRAALAAGLWALITERGLPRPLAPAERGAPGEMSEAEVAPLLARALGDVPPASREALAGPARQLVKACFYPEFKTCRDSFREVAPDGSCRRQELARALGRVSGAHCVDCPHWVALNPEQHARFLARAWRPPTVAAPAAGRDGPAEFMAHRGVFLPEDFRALRRFLHALARAGI